MKKRSLICDFKIMVKTITLSILIFLLIVPLANAEPSKLIRKMIETPASVFDVFLFQLKERYNCDPIFHNHEGGIGFCMLKANYNFDDNVIDMVFFVNPRHKLMNDFASATKNQKEEIMKTILDRVTFSLKNAMKYGGILRVPIRNSWATDNFNEKEIREEIIKRTQIELSHSDRTRNQFYQIIRDHNGRIFYETRPIFAK